jgi:hypothetical protein
MKKVLIAIGVVILVLAAAGGSFYGGMAYQRNQVSQIRSQFFSQRGSTTAQAGGQPGANSQARRDFFGGAVNGQVKTIDGNVLTVSTAQDVTTVNLSDTTKIEKAGSVNLSDLQPGDRVMVIGPRDSKGNVTASQILILGDIVLGAPPAGTAVP